MKQIRSKKLDSLRQVVDLARQRVAKVKLEMDELSRRNWKGGEMPYVQPVKEVAEQLAIAMDALRMAERHMDSLVTKARTAGK